MTSPKAPDNVKLLDAASIVLVVVGVLCASLISLPPRAQLVQATPLLFGLALTVRVIRDRQSAARHETVRTVRPRGKRWDLLPWPEQFWFPSSSTALSRGTAG